MGATALGVVRETERRLNEIAGIVRNSPADAPARVSAIVEERRKLERSLADVQRKLATGEGGGASEVESVGGVRLVARNIGEVAPRELKGMAESILKQIGDGIVTLVSTAEGKASVVVAVAKPLTSQFSAIDLVRHASAAVGGKGGGGRPDLAQAGGPLASQADAALAAVREKLAA